LGSIASYLALEGDDKQPVGMEINANHIRSVSSGFVTGKCSPLHLGNTSHLWQIQIFNENSELVCISRFTVFIRGKR
jgi:1,4-dihydroxy-2-naphthoyl-CoA hydrolase